MALSLDKVSRWFGATKSSNGSYRVLATPLGTAFPVQITHQAHSDSTHHHHHTPRRSWNVPDLFPFLQIEVETSSLLAASEAVEAGADIVMLDNMRPAELHDVARQLKERYGQHKFLIEASGGITSQTIKEFFGPHVDIISM
jgi:nicotinate-nucleotide pyrophosphorylase